MTKKKQVEAHASRERLHLEAKPGQTHERAIADLVVDGSAANAYLTTLYSYGAFRDISLTDAVASLRETTSAVKDGDLHAAERLLVAQAVALNSMFAELARRAAMNMGEHLQATDTYLRLALRAQAQSRATLETLGALKNPPVVIARQANINNGGQQLVNIGAMPHPSPGRAEELRSQPNELSGPNHELRADTRTSCSAGEADLHLASVGAVIRTEHG